MITNAEINKNYRTGCCCIFSVKMGCAASLEGLVESCSGVWNAFTHILMLRLVLDECVLHLVSNVLRRSRSGERRERAAVAVKLPSLWHLRGLGSGIRLRMWVRQRAGREPRARQRRTDMSAGRQKSCVRLHVWLFHRLQRLVKKLQRKKRHLEQPQDHQQFFWVLLKWCTKSTCVSGLYHKWLISR